MKKTTVLALSLATVLFAGQAMAEHHEGKGPGGRHGKMFEETDSNKDGTVTKDEFRAQGDKLFAKLDTNGDGTITKDEHEARKQEWKAKREEWKAKKQAGATKAE